MKFIKLSLIIFLFLLPLISAVSIIEFDFTVYKNDTVVFDCSRFYEGIYERPLFGNPDYVLEIRDVQGNIVEQTQLPVLFFHPDIGFTNQSMASVKLPYQPHWKTIQIYHSGILIFEQAIAACNNNALCEENENHVSCENDCPSGSKDGWCDRKIDGICDADCLAGMDSDCLSKFGMEYYLKKNISWVIILTGFVILLVAIILSIRRKLTNLKKL